MNFALASLIVETLIGLGWIGVIYYGISRYEKLNDRICADMKQRHAKTMAAFDTQRQTLDMQRQALETLIARTGGSGTS